MKKGVMIFLGLILLISFVVNVSAENATVTNGNLTCTDSDGGDSWYVKGTVKSALGVTTSDQCVNSTLLNEHSCPEQQHLSSGTRISAYICPFACSNGVCVNETASTSCTDSDGGLDYYTTGYRLNQNPSYASYNIKQYDYCIKNPTVIDGSVIADEAKEVSTCSGENCYVIEYQCKEDLSKAHVGYECPNGCNDGACIPGGEDYDIFVRFQKAEIRLIQDEGVAADAGLTYYYYFGVFGDKTTMPDFIVRVDMVKPNGEIVRLDIPVDPQTLSCGESGECPIQDGTFSLFLSELGTYQIEILGDVNSDVYESHYEINNFDLLTVEWNGTGASVVAVSGTEVEEGGNITTEFPNETEITNEESDKIAEYSCSGCVLDNKCYPFGYRKSGKYCSELESFAEPIETGACENNFECSSNLCVNDECVGRSFIQKIIDWFRKILGSVIDEGI